MKKFIILFSVIIWIFLVFCAYNLIDYDFTKSEILNLYSKLLNASLAIFVIKGMWFSILHQDILKLLNSHSLKVTSQSIRQNIRLLYPVFFGVACILIVFFIFSIYPIIGSFEFSDTMKSFVYKISFLLFVNLVILTGLFLIIALKPFYEKFKELNRKYKEVSVQEKKVGDKRF